MKMEVFIEKRKDGDMAGKYFVHIGEECSSGYRVFVSSIEQAAEEVEQYILENYNEEE